MKNAERKEMDGALDEIYGSISHLYNYEEPDLEDMVAQVKELSEYSDSGHGRACECYPCQQSNYRMDRDDPSVEGDEG